MEGVLGPENSRRPSKALALQSSCIQGNRHVSIYLNRSRSGVRVPCCGKLRLNKALMMILLLNTWIAPLQFTEFFFFFF